MARYKKTHVPPRPAQSSEDRSAPLLGMLFVVDVRMIDRATNEKIRHKVLLVGCENDDIERKLRWMFDATRFAEFSIAGVEKVREKVHYLQTTITKAVDDAVAVIDRDGRSQPVGQPPMAIERYDPHLYAVGIATTILARDEAHALRKVANALLATATHGASHTGASLSDDSTVTVEAVPRSSGYAMPRDVSAEANRAQMVRG